MFSIRAIITNVVEFFFARNTASATPRVEPTTAIIAETPTNLPPQAESRAPVKQVLTQNANTPDGAQLATPRAQSSKYAPRRQARAIKSNNSGRISLQNTPILLPVPSKQHPKNDFVIVAHPLFVSFAKLKAVVLTRLQKMQFVEMLRHVNNVQFLDKAKRLLDAMGYELSVVNASDNGIIATKDGKRVYVHTFNNAESLTILTKRALGVNMLNSIKRDAKQAGCENIIIMTAGRTSMTVKADTKHMPIYVVDGQFLLKLLVAYSCLNAEIHERIKNADAA